MNNFFEYMRDQKERAAEVERIANRSFEDCLKETKGNHYKASLILGRAYWEAKAPGRYKKEYDRLIAGTPKPPPLPISDEEAEAAIQRRSWPLWYVKKYFPHILAKVLGHPIPPPAAADETVAVKSPHQAGAPSPPESKEPDLTEENLPF